MGNSEKIYNKDQRNAPWNMCLQVSFYSFCGFFPSLLFFIFSSFLLTVMVVALTCEYAKNRLIVHFFFIQVELIYNVVLVSGIQYSDSLINIYTHSSDSFPL